MKNSLKLLPLLCLLSLLACNFVSLPYAFSGYNTPTL